MAVKNWPVRSGREARRDLHDTLLITVLLDVLSIYFFLLWLFGVLGSDGSLKDGSAETRAETQNFHE
jgi:hypothetical protein